MLKLYHLRILLLKEKQVHLFLKRTLHLYLKLKIYLSCENYIFFFLLKIFNILRNIL